jgi:hypothetical protein
MSFFNGKSSVKKFIQYRKKKTKLEEKNLMPAGD